LSAIFFCSGATKPHQNLFLSKCMYKWCKDEQNTFETLEEVLPLQIAKTEQKRIPFVPRTMIFLF